MSELETTIRHHIAATAKPAQIAPESIDLNVDLKQEFGISSMKMILLMTTLCKELGVTLSSFDERDLAGINSAGDLIRAFEKAREGVAS